MADRSSSLFLYASEDKADDDHKFSIAAAQAAITFAAPSAGEQDFKADFKSYQFRKADDSYFNLETRFGAIEGDQASANNAAAITALQADLAMEQNARVSGDGALTLSVNAEVTARIAAVAACQADVDQNEADADAAFAVVAGTVTQEIADRVSAVSAEAAARVAAVASLQSQITNILSDATPQVLDDLASIVAAFQSADSTLTGALAALTTRMAAAEAVINEALGQSL